MKHILAPGDRISATYQHLDNLVQPYRKEIRPDHKLLIEKDLD